MFPNEYWDGAVKMNEIHLPQKEAFFRKHFFSHLAGDGILDDDHQHTQLVWRAFLIFKIWENIMIFI